MKRNILRRNTVDVGVASVGGIVIGLVVLLWVSVWLRSPATLTNAVRAGVGTVLAVVVLGGLLARLFGVPTNPIGRFALYAAGLSLATLAVLTTAMSVLLPLVGVTDPLSTTPLVVAVSGLLVGLVIAVHYTDTTFETPHVALPRGLPIVGLSALPVLAVVGAVLMNRYGVNTGTIVFVGAVVVVVAATARLVSQRLYPAMVVSVSLSTLLHHNLLSDHVIGGDIQATYFVAELLTQLQQWTPATGGSLMAIPVVTTVPASISTLAGISLTTTFTVVYVLLFALVPLGVFSVCRDVFDDDVAVFAALFFVFYHVTFSFTPGKQLVSELFAIVLVAIVVRGDLRGHGRTAAVALLSLGLIGSHYGTTYLFGVGVLVAAIAAFVVDRLIGEVGPRPPIRYPVALLVGASAWYAAVSPALSARLASLPAVIVGQLATLFGGGSVIGSGGSYVGQQTATLSTVNIGLYGLFTVLLCVGIAWRLLATLRSLGRGSVPDDVSYTVFSIPVFVFLASSYFLVFNLWADRVYQMALVFIAPFMPLGYRYVVTAARAAGKRLPSLRPTSKLPDGGVSRDTDPDAGFESRSTPERRVGWTALGVLLGALLVFNSGLAFSVVGASQSSAFNPNANDLVFSQAEVEGVTWLKTHADPPRLRTHEPVTPTRPGAVRIYGDTRSVQLLRSVLPPGYYDVKTIPLKSKWRSNVDSGRLNDGYVVIRGASIANADDAEGAYSRIAKRDVRAIVARGTVVFRNHEIRVVRIGSDPTVAGTDE